MLNYRLEGNGSPILLLHGWGVTFPIWKDLAPLLSPNYQLVMVELPGFGSSPPPETEQPYFQTCVEQLEELRNFLGIKKWAVLSYSVGTRVGEAYLRRYPAVVSSVVFLCPLYQDAARISTLRSAMEVDHLLPRFGDWILSGWRISLLIRTLGFNGRRTPNIMEWQREVARQSKRSLKLMLRDMSKYAHVPFKYNPKQVIYIWGKSDHLVVRPRKPQSTDYFVPAAHDAPMKAAPQIAEVVTHFLSGKGVPKGNSRQKLDE
jgi:pimeloyl-ACP methyl ester carboxylesterase